MPQVKSAPIQRIVGRANNELPTNVELGDAPTLRLFAVVRNKNNPKGNATKPKATRHANAANTDFDMVPGGFILLSLRD